MKGMSMKREVTWLVRVKERRKEEKKDNKKIK
jgi:hypothetical protein